MNKYNILSLLLIISFDIFAELKIYETPIDESYWSLVESSPLECKIKHIIDKFGVASFSSVASKEPSMFFSLSMMARPNQVTEVSLISRAPSWRAGSLDRHLLDLSFQKYSDGEISSRIAWVMLSELDLGMMPTFFYSDWSNPKTKVAVGLSPANFSSSYLEFKQCLSNLLDFNLKDYSFLVLNYINGLQLSRQSIEDLDKIKKYLSYDSDVINVEIDVYTDSYGTYEENKSIAIARKDELVDFFLQNNIQQEKIMAEYHVMDNYIDSNSLESGRFKNRRAVIRINKIY